MTACYYPQMKKPKYHSLKEATQKLMRFCTYRERCHKEVKSKLFDLNIHPNDQEEIIVKLIQHGFLNEERFAKIFAYDKFHLQKWGKYRIERELKFREISDYLIKKGLEEIDEEEYQKTFQELLNKKVKTTKEKNPLKKKKKIADFLLRKGFESTLVYESLQKIKL